MRDRAIITANELELIVRDAMRLLASISQDWDTRDWTDLEEKSGSLLILTGLVQGRANGVAFPGDGRSIQFRIRMEGKWQDLATETLRRRLGTSGQVEIAPVDELRLTAAGAEAKRYLVDEPEFIYGFLFTEAERGSKPVVAIESWRESVSNQPAA